MLEMHQAGGSTRDIATAIGVADRTVRLWLAERGLVSTVAPGRRSAKERATEGPGSPLGAAPAPVDFGAVEVVKARLVAVRDSLTRVQPLFEQGDFPVERFEKLIKLETFLAAQVAELTPPAPPDPEKDPSNQEAADNVRMRLSKIIAVERDRAKCVHCGSNPFKKGAA